ncbi:MAG: ATP-grasp domain-containing protein [Candidatus Altiarchaeales archaeon]|nr:ATP-grasp domain-containing protein [Candidatus Altiarchaeales archaeon]
MIVGFTYNSKKKTPSDMPEDFYAEFDEPATINAIRDAIASGGHRVVMMEAKEDIFEKIKSNSVDIIFNIAEGIRGESRESQVPIICEMFGVPYSGSGPLTLALTLDKAKTKEILLYNKIPTPKFQVFKTGKEKLINILKFPLIVKPIREGSSKGIRDNSVVKNKKELYERINETLSLYSQPVLVEQFLSGREFTVAIIGNKNPWVLPIVEVLFDDLPPGVNKIDSYEAKWVWDDPKKPLDCLVCPARITKKMEKTIREISLKAYNALDCRDWARLDLRLDLKGVPNVLEVNALPGVIPDPKCNSRFPKAARTAGLGYNEMILSVLDEAMVRCKLK